MAYHLSTKAATPPGSSNMTSWSNKVSSSEDVNLFRIQNEVSKMSLDGTSKQQRRTFALHVPRCIFNTPPPLVAKTKIKQQRESSLPPPTSSTSTSMPIGIFLGRRKRQRCDRGGPPPMFPSSPEFDSTADTNPFGRHIAIHSPIAGVGNTLNLEFIAGRRLRIGERGEK
ncbi:hypothetical protein FRACYDRAFT_242265 [Fragilariopsis cylindrus CCMP1102]|uniref:Uncharacterized protein n=1 Tax=Fragilariopsis cylindrus CCMP1102 TaxID=635003 RepID=A0A1E7F6V7_9STRA|nr:hypothetical protein FRACYDRAFT_242265 [Fragilariopsis cylindrus CCMP1102]|eukprot:OEU13911.1 hypothetical protein FRACYDRAFT_242265 [Fragilariopsis cylindrus CCMP1102]